MNFIKYVLAPLLGDLNIWLFRLEYIVTYYTYRALRRLKNHQENNDDIVVDRGKLLDLLNTDSKLFNSSFRNIMMHYGLNDADLKLGEKIEKPFYGIIEQCFDGMDFVTCKKRIEEYGNQLIEFLEEYINMESFVLQEL